MIKTREEAIAAALNFLSDKVKCRVEIVNNVSGNFYNPGNINVDNYWIVYVRPEQMMLDGEQNYILVHKKTGELMFITTGGG
jgi:hypothetical protein